MLFGISRTLVIWTALIAIPAVVACAISYATFRSQLTDNAAKNLQFLHKTELARVQSTLHTALDSVNKLAATPILQSLVDAHFLASLSVKAPQSFPAGKTLGVVELNAQQPLQGLTNHLMEQTLSNAPNLTSITIIGKVGDVLGQTGDTTWPTSIQKAQIPNELGKLSQISQVWKTTNGSMIVGITAPIFYQSNRILGYLRAEFAIDSILKPLDAYTELGDSAEAFLIIRNGTQTSILSSQGLAPADEIMASLPAQYASGIEQSPGLQTSEIVNTEKLQGIQTITAIGAIAETNWILLFSIDKSEVIAPTNMIRVMLVLAVAATLLITLIVILIVIRPLMGRIKNIATASDNFSNRKFKFYINDEKKDEIGVLAFHIDNIAAELASKTNLQAAVHEQIHYRDTHDETTGLLNRHSLMQILSELKPASSDHAINALAIDFGFNLSHENQQGNVDEYVTLTNFCKMLEELAPNSVHAALWNNSTIMVLLPDATTDAITTLKQNIGKWQQTQTKIKGSTRLTLRYGSASASSTNNTDDLFRQAFEELTLQKNNDSEMSNASLGSALFVETAIKENRIEVWYQPVVEIADDSTLILIGAEAIVRIRSESGEIHLAEEFMPHIQDHSAGSNLDKTVVSLVTKSAATWNDLSRSIKDFSISINLTRRSLNNMNMMEHIAVESAQNAFDIQSLIFEVSPTSINAQLDNLMLYNSMGVRFAIDDVGIQNFSFSQLKSLQPDLVKINWANISKASQSSDGLTAKHFLNLIKFFRSIGTDVVAKNIENQGQAIAMNKHGIRLMQGYQFGAPVDLHTFIEQSHSYTTIANTTIAKQSAV